jgi:hypothetical protein
MCSGSPAASAERALAGLYGPRLARGMAGRVEGSLGADQGLWSRPGA